MVGHGTSKLENNKDEEQYSQILCALQYLAIESERTDLFLMRDRIIDAIRKIKCDLGKRTNEIYIVDRTLVDSCTMLWSFNKCDKTVKKIICHLMKSSDKSH